MALVKKNLGKGSGVTRISGASNLDGTVTAFIGSGKEKIFERKAKKVATKTKKKLKKLDKKYEKKKNNLSIDWVWNRN